MADVAVSSVVMSVSGRSISSRNNSGVIAVNRNNDEISFADVARVVEAAETIQMPKGYELLHTIPNEYIIDAQGGIKYPIGMSGDRLEVDCHIVLVPTGTIRNFEKLVQKLAIAVDNLAFSGWADNYSVLTDTEKELGVTLLDIGAGTTDIAVFQEGKIVYTSAIPVGGSNVTNDIAVGLHLSSLDDAEQIKIHYKEILERAKNIKAEQKVKNVGDEGEKAKKNDAEDEKPEGRIVDISFLNLETVKKIDVDFLSKVIRMRVEDILDLAKNEVANAGFNIATPAGIVVAGGTAKLHGITGIIKDVFKVPARDGVPHGLQGMVDEIRGPEYATAQGLVWFALNNVESSRISSDSKGRGVGGILNKVKSIFKSLMP